MKGGAIVIFGEDNNDREAIKELVLSLHPTAPKILKREKPLVLMKKGTTATRRSNSEKIAAVVRADRVRYDIKAVLTHEDCDDVEPAHVNLSKIMVDNLKKCGVEAVPVTPAFEMEAWWFLWPDAVVAVNSNWNRPSMAGREVGMIQNAKEALRAALSKGKRAGQVKGYEESDAPRIARKVRELGIVHKKDATSRSFDHFVKLLNDSFPNK